MRVTSAARQPGSQDPEPADRHRPGARSATDALLEMATAMNTAKQAIENMEYVRRLLEEKQAGFAASVELAVSFIYRQLEQPEGRAD